MTPHFSGSNNSDSATVTTLLGIWRVGPQFHTSQSTQLSLAQPADAPENPRWDYVVKRAAGKVELRQARSEIAQTIAASAEVRHPHLVSVLDGTSSSVSPYVVMPRLNGRTMGQLMQEAEPTTLPVAWWLTRQVAEALAAMHSRGWIHADVTPDNVIVAGNGHVTLVDLASAKRIKTKIEAADDVFALGRLLWQWMLHVRVSDESQLDSVATLVEQMIDSVAVDRPTASDVVKTLLRIELKVLSQQIGPGEVQPVRRAA